MQWLQSKTPKAKPRKSYGRIAIGRSAIREKSDNEEEIRQKGQSSGRLMSEGVEGQLRV